MPTFRLGMRDVALPVDVEVIAVGELNVPFPSFGLRARRPFAPAAGLEVDVFALPVLSQRLVRAPVLRWDEREVSSDGQVMLSEDAAARRFVIFRCALKRLARLWVGGAHGRPFALPDHSADPAVVNAYADRLAAAVDDVLGDRLARVPQR